MISELKLDLLKEGYSFSFFQAIRLLRLMHRKPQKTASINTASDPVWVRPKLSLGFPKADIESIVEVGDDGTDQFDLRVNFLGLYGTSSPLPIFYTEDLIDEAADDESVAREFIDVINQRIYQLFYDCCTKYQQAFKVVEEGSQPYMARLFCLLGIGDEKIRSQVPNPGSLLRYLGLFTQMPHSAMGLETLLNDALLGMPVSVIPCIARRAKIPDDQKLRLGASSQRLGLNCFLGKEISDRTGKFRVQVGPLTKDEFQCVCPGTDLYQHIKLLVNLYVVGSLEYDLEVILADGEAQTVCLGDTRRSELGLNSWVFSGDHIGEVRTVYRA